MKRLKILIATSVALLICSASYGQKIHFSGALQNMHLWRGLQVADGGVLSADLNVGFLDDGLKVGLWGGTDFTGDYKEFDYYASYTVAGFTVAVWDIYNYSPDLPYSKDIFNYRWVLSIPFFISCIRQQNPLTVLSKIILRKVKQFNLPPPQKK